MFDVGCLIVDVPGKVAFSCRSNFSFKRDSFEWDTEAVVGDLDSFGKRVA